MEKWRACTFFPPLFSKFPTGAGELSSSSVRAGSFWPRTSSDNSCVLFKKCSDKCWDKWSSPCDPPTNNKKSPLSFHWMTTRKYNFHNRHNISVWPNFWQKFAKSLWSQIWCPCFCLLRELLKTLQWTLQVQNLRSCTLSQIYLSAILG